MEIKEEKAFRINKIAKNNIEFQFIYEKNGILFATNDLTTVTNPNLVFQNIFYHINKIIDEIFEY
jgi:hypothetical protein